MAPDDVSRGDDPAVGGDAVGAGGTEAGQGGTLPRTGPGPVFLLLLVLGLAFVFSGALLVYGGRSVERVRDLTT